MALYKLALIELLIFCWNLLWWMQMLNCWWAVPHSWLTITRTLSQS